MRRANYNLLLEREKFRLSLLYSIILHVVFVAGGMLAFYYSPPAIDLSKTTTKVRLVRKGKHLRKEDLLPRKEEPLAEKPTHQKEPVSSPVKGPSEPSSSLAKIAPKRVDRKKTSQQSSLLDALKKHTQKWSDEGDPNSKEEQGELRGDLADSYEARLQALIREQFSVPSTLTTRERERLLVTLKIRIDEEGRLIEVKIIEKSGNSIFDNAAKEAVKNVASFGGPPLLLTKVYERRGIELQFCPIECKN